MNVAETKRIVAVRFRRPGGNQDLEVRFESDQYNDADAVFTSVDAVEKILVPLYESLKAGDGKRLLEEVRKQEQDGVCLVIHKFSCRRLVPAIDWNAESPIRL